MVTKRFICRRCGDRFPIEVFEPGEQDERQIRGEQVTCPRCRSGEIEPC